MKKSELKKYIKAEIVNELSIGEATIETSPENLDKVKQKADKDDVIRVTEENIGLADLEEMGYEAGEKAFDMHFNIVNIKKFS
jgi:ribosomal protein L19E